jgi:hypothetical protein
MDVKPSNATAPWAFAFKAAHSNRRRSRSRLQPRDACWPEFGNCRRRAQINSASLRRTEEGLGCQIREEPGVMSLIEKRHPYRFRPPAASVLKGSGDPMRRSLRNCVFPACQVITKAQAAGTFRLFQGNILVRFQQVLTNKKAHSLTGNGL